MKTLKQHIAESKALHQNVNIKENFKFKINRNNDVYAYHPTTWEELREIIEKRYKEFGPGTAEAPIDFNDIDVSEIDTFYHIQSDTGLFQGTTFEYIDISDWNVSNIEDMEYMFAYCKQLKSIGNLSNWDVSNVKYMISMFNGCESLESVGDLSKWNVLNVEDMYGMFCDCYNLKSVGDLSKWDVSNVENMQWMFNRCENLKIIGDISNWDISNGKDTKHMFLNSGIINKPKWYKE